MCPAPFGNGFARETSASEQAQLTINIARATLKEMSHDEVWQLGMSQFIIDAKPSEGSLAI